MGSDMSWRKLNLSNYRFSLKEPTCSSLRPAPAAEQSTTGKRKAFFASCVWEAADLSTSGRRGSACKGNIHPLINIVAVAPFLIIHSKTLALEFTLYVEFTDKVNFEYRVNLCCAYKAVQVEESYGVKAEGISYFYRK